jgi:Transposase zinc-binding domain
MGGSAVESAQCYEARPGAASAPLPAGYRRREPEKSVLHEVFREHLETFLAQAREHGRGLPRHVENELRRYLSCGQLSEGFVRVRCQRCKEELFVALSCKGRSFCGKAELAAFSSNRPCSLA